MHSILGNNFSIGLIQISFLIFLENRLWQFIQIVSRKIGFESSCKETICMKCQSLFAGKNQENIINMSIADLPRE